MQGNKSDKQKGGNQINMRMQIMANGDGDGDGDGDGAMRARWNGDEACQGAQ